MASNDGTEVNSQVNPAPHIEPPLNADDKENDSASEHTSVSRMSRKRAASTSVDERPTKEARLDNSSESSAVEVTGEGQVVKSDARAAEPKVSKTGDTQEDRRDAIIKDLKKRLNEAENDAHKFRLREIEAEKDRDDWIESNEVLEKENKRLQARLSAARKDAKDAGGNVVANSKRIEAKIKTELEGKRQKAEDKLKAKLKEREEYYKSLIKEKNAAHKEEMAEQREKCKEDLAAVKAKFAGKIREQGETIQSQVEEIAKLNIRAERLDSRVRHLDESNQILSKKLREREESLEKSRRQVETQAEEEQKMRAELVQKQNSFNELRAHESKRFQLQYDQAENLKRDMIPLQRATHAQRVDAERKAKQIADLEAKVQILRETAQYATGDAQAVNTQLSGRATGLAEATAETECGKDDVASAEAMVPNEKDAESMDGYATATEVNDVLGMEEEKLDGAEQAESALSEGAT